MKIDIIKSGSAGNLYSVQQGDSALLLEGGADSRLLILAGHSISDYDAMLISHEHGDHAANVDFFLNWLDVYASAGTIEALDINHRRLKEIKVNQPLIIKNAKISSFNVKHDAREPIGFHIRYKDQGVLLYATDTSYLPYKVKDLRWLMIECNYSKEIISNNKDKGLIAEEHFARVIDNHLSLEIVEDFLKKNNLSKLEKIFLLHISDTNGDKEGFINRIESITGVPVYSI